MKQITKNSIKLSLCALFAISLCSCATAAKKAAKASAKASVKTAKVTGGAVKGAAKSVTGVGKKKTK